MLYAHELYFLTNDEDAQSHVVWCAEYETSDKGESLTLDERVDLYFETAEYRATIGKGYAHEGERLSRAAVRQAIYWVMLGSPDSNV
jgi:hypothetical protein